MTDDIDDLTDEQLAALDEYEKSQESKAARQPKPENRAAQLTKLFLKTPEMVEYAQVIGDVNDKLDTDDTVTVGLQIPKQFITMLEFVERTEAAHEGREPEPVGEVLNLMLVNQLQEELHLLVVAPEQFPRNRDLYNRFCDEQGAPEHKILPEQEAPTEESPF
jgi:hypothetical protein